VGWVLNVQEGASVFPPPSEFVPKKPNRKLSGSYLSCPSVLSYFKDTFEIKAPYSLHLRYSSDSASAQISPVFPGTSLSESKLASFLTVEPFESWPNQHTVVLQMKCPYIFFADEPTVVEQFGAAVSSFSNLNWRLIPGSFDIFAWQRPLNWAIEWDTRCGDLKLSMGEPLFFLKFRSAKYGSKCELVECVLTPQLNSRIKECEGVTHFRRGTSALIKEGGKNRKGLPLISVKP